jgi:hypothetical protein
MISTRALRPRLVQFPWLIGHDRVGAEAVPERLVSILLERAQGASWHGSIFIYPRSSGE